MGPKSSMEVDNFEIYEKMQKSSKIPSELSSAVNSTTIWYQTRLHYMQSLQLCMLYFWNTLLTDILFFRSHLHIFGTITFTWTKSHLHPIIHLHTKYQDCMCSGSWAFVRDGHTYIPTYLHTYIPTYIHTDIQTPCRPTI